MEDYIGGSITKDERPLLREKISKIIQNSLHRDISLLNSDITETMEKAKIMIKKINLINKRKNIDLDKYKTTTYPAFLWQEEYIACFYLFATLIGYIDKKINEEKKRINFNSKFIFSNDSSSSKEISKSNNKIYNYLNDREDALNKYKIILKDSVESDVILKTLETQPSYNNFENLYKIDEESGMQLYVYQHLINAYNIGYISNENDYNSLITKYKILLDEVLNDKLDRELQTSKAKKKNIRR